MPFNLSTLAVREQSVSLYFLMICVVAGIYASFVIERAEDPSFTVKAMVVTVVWPGSTADELDRQVIRQIEKSIQRVGQLERIESTLQPGFGSIVLEFRDYIREKELRNLKYEVRRRLDELSKYLPPQVQGPYLNEDFSDVYFGIMALASDKQLPAQIVNQHAELLRDQLQGVKGVKKVVIIGRQEQELVVEFENARMMAMGMPPEHLIHALQAYNLIQPTGDFPTDGATVRFRIRNTLQSANDIAALPLYFDGHPLRIGDIARIYLQEKTPSREKRRSNGRNAVMLGVVMEDDADGLQLGTQLEEFLITAHSQLPVGTSLDMLSNQAEAIDATVSLFQIKFIIAVFVVLMVSIAAIGFKAGLIVGVAVPVTIGLTFLLMIASDINLNRVTLGALILALGLLVDDAIIAIEMMIVKMGEGFSPAQAASHSWCSTASPMLFGTLVTIAGFVPIGFAQSSTGEYAGGMFWVLAYSLVISWLVAVTFTPYLGVKLLTPQSQPTHSNQNLQKLDIYTRLRPIINFCVHKPWLITGLTASAFTLALIGMKLGVQQQFFPSSDRPEVLVSIQLPHGTHIDNTDAIVRKLEDSISSIEEVQSFSSHVGVGAPRFFISASPAQPNPSFAQIVAQTASKEARDAAIEKLNRLIAAGDFHQALIRVYSLRYGPPVTWPVEFRITGPDRQKLREIGLQVWQVVNQQTNTRNTNFEWNERTPILRLDDDRDHLAQMHLNPSIIASQFETEMGGSTATTLRKGIEQIPIKVQGSREYQQSGYSLQLKNAQGLPLPSSQIGDFIPAFEDSYFKRYNRRYSLSIRADVIGAQAKSVSLSLWDELESLRVKLPQDYKLELGGAVSRAQTANEALVKLLPLVAILCVSLIMLQMRSFSGTLMVMGTAPLGVIGAVLALLVTNTAFGFVSLLGMLGLAGILMRNTLILAQQIQDNLATGSRLEVAIVDATISRARPVILTALAAVLAFVPLSLDAFWGPMAIVLIGGVTVGTIITLLFFPALARLCLHSKA